RSAIARPIPCAPPVMSPTRPASFPDFSCEFMLTRASAASPLPHCFDENQLGTVWQSQVHFQTATRQIFTACGLVGGGVIVKPQAVLFSGIQTLEEEGVG